MNTMNTAELAMRWDTTSGRLANMRSECAGPRYFKIGTRVLYRTEDVHAFEEKHMVVMAGAA